MAGMPDLHLVIADAVPARREGVPLPKLPPLPHLLALLTRLRPAGRLCCDEDAPDTPFERILAQLHGLPGAPGQVPWAAFATGTTGAACAWLRPCHWQLGMDSARVMDPASLALSEAESRALLQTIAPYLLEEGIAIAYQRPDAWLVRSPLFDGLHTHSAARAAQAPLSREALAPGGSDAATTLRRLQSEWQMLLADHPVNAAREDDGRPIVNALWLEGAGTLAARPAAQPQVRAELRLAAAGPDLDRRHAAWQALDADSVAQLQAAAESGAAVRLTLCGPRCALTLQSARGLGRLAARLRPLQLEPLRGQL